MNIKLSPDAIFPITVDEFGFPVKKNKTGLDIAGTIQGEGLLAGVPCLFIRLSGCNLRCSWTAPDGTVDICDTPYASHNVTETTTIGIDTVIEVVRRNIGTMRHVVISGGEPTLQPKALGELCMRLSAMDLHITIETNGTMFSDDFAYDVNLFSISPKLESSNPQPFLGPVFSGHAKKRINFESIRKYIKMHQYNPHKYDYQLKFVISKPEDVEEILGSHLMNLSVDPSKIFLMPLGSNPEVLAKTRLLTVKAAIENGWRYSPRLHVDIFGNVAGT